MTGDPPNLIPGQIQYSEPGMLLLPTDLLAALRFLKWCDANDKSMELAEAWILDEVRKLP